MRVLFRLNRHYPLRLQCSLMFCIRMLHSLIVLVLPLKGFEFATPGRRWDWWFNESPTWTQHLAFHGSFPLEYCWKEALFVRKIQGWFPCYTHKHLVRHQRQVGEDDWWEWACEITPAVTADGEKSRSNLWNCWSFLKIHPKNIILVLLHT